MASKEPVLLTVLIETGQFRWYVAGVALDGGVAPLICSEAGNLLPYRGVPLDEQVNFLRHRLSGVLQRGCDRVWGRQQKPCQIVFVADGPFVDAAPELARGVGEHFVAWMANPPVVYFESRGGFLSELSPTLVPIAGDANPVHHRALEIGLPRLFAALQQVEAWELIPPKKDVERGNLA
jgi:hypothetical protein